MSTLSFISAAVNAATLQDVQRFYEETVFSDASSRIVIQLRGKRYSERPFATVEGGVMIDDIDKFHNEMPVQAR